MRETFISGDIGGTNTRLRIFEINAHDSSTINTSKSIRGSEAPGLLLLKKTYHNQDFSSFGEVVRAFLKEAAVSKPPITACLAAAGPVKNNIVRFTNRDSWEIDGDQIGEELGIKKVFLINDFVAAGYGVLTLDIDKECKVLQKASHQSSAPIACIGAGTGLGQCYLTPSGDDMASGDYRCFPSEGGHADFAPRNELEFGLLSYLKQKFEQKHRVSVERIVSGTGLANVYDYLCALYPHKVDALITGKMESAGDMKGAVIATNQQNELCKKTMEIFITAYGAEAGVAALKWLPYGGLYLCGGLTPKNIELITDPAGGFMTSLLDKGRITTMLNQVPIYAVMAEDLGERGAHYMAYKEFCKEMYIPPKTKLLFNEHLNISGDVLNTSQKSQHSDNDNELLEYNQNWFHENSLNLTLFSVTLIGAFLLGMSNIRKK
mmetsp:Transcript_1084/g.1214  ORF Transcript_1084/g.1214 Transcript_1084/m.1214 type:complete len:434 (+) Transcript_1084:124-1425(+)